MGVKCVAMNFSRGKTCLLNNVKSGVRVRQGQRQWRIGLIIFRSARFLDIFSFSRLLGTRRLGIEQGVWRRKGRNIGRK